MRSAWSLSLLLFLSSLPSLGVPAELSAEICDACGPPDITSGLWAVVFLVPEKCSACERVIEWIERAVVAFPEYEFLVAAPHNMSRAKEVLPDGVRLYVDADGGLGLQFRVTEAPTLVLAADGAFLSRLEWPFTEGGLLRALAETVLIALSLIRPGDLIGCSPPPIPAVDTRGEEMGLQDLPRPLLLSFLSPDCTPCWESLPIMEELRQWIEVALLMIAGSQGLSDEHRARLEPVLGEDAPRSVHVLVLQDPSTLRTYGVTHVPSYFVLDEEGIVRAVHEGSATLQELVDLIESVRRSEGNE